MLEYLRMRKFTCVTTAQDIKVEFPDLRYAPGFNVIGGLLLVPLSAGGGDFIVFFRKSQAKEVKWAGNPYQKFVKNGTDGYLEPRKSFKTWSEIVVGKCREWTEEQVETASILCLVCGKFIQVWREKELALKDSQLTRLLVANSAHEVRTPLNAIINYLEIALEGRLKPKTRETITKSHAASKSLVYIINDLLDLTKTEEGQNLIRDEAFNLPETVREAADAFSRDAKRKGIDYQVVEHPAFPQYVLRDQRRIRQAIANIIANSVQNTMTGSIYIEMWLHSTIENKATIEIVVQDSGAGMSDKKLDELFRELEQVSEDGGVMLLNSSNQRLLKKHARQTLGLGLAMVARIIRNMEGQLRVKSEEGKGSRFVMQLTFSLPNEKDEGSTSAYQMLSSSQAASGSVSSIIMTPLDATEGEVTLIKKDSGPKGDSGARKRSLDEVSSLRSFRSGSSSRSNKSDVDRLVDAIYDPLLVGDVESEERQIQRREHKESCQNRQNAANLETQAAVVSRDSPTMAARTIRNGALDLLRSPPIGPPSSNFTTDSKLLTKAAKRPDEFSESASEAVQPHAAPNIVFDLPDRSKKTTPQSTPLGAENLSTLVAEDDPVNSRIMTKRLERSGHKVYVTINGNECAIAYRERPAFFDVVLMDMQMPIVDGLTSAKIIHSFENSHARQKRSARESVHRRVPIFVVSASLVERDRQLYINAGFDGWIPKPIDFKRLDVLLSGITDKMARIKWLHQPGEWERGGWFHD